MGKFVLDDGGTVVAYTRNGEIVTIELRAQDGTCLLVTTVPCLAGIASVSFVDPQSGLEEELAVGSAGYVVRKRTGSVLCEVERKVPAYRSVKNKLRTVQHIVYEVQAFEAQQGRMDDAPQYKMVREAVKTRPVDDGKYMERDIAIEWRGEVREGLVCGPVFKPKDGAETVYRVYIEQDVSAGYDTGISEAEDLPEDYYYATISGEGPGDGPSAATQRALERLAEIMPERPPSVPGPRKRASRPRPDPIPARPRRIDLEE